MPLYVSTKLDISLTLIGALLAGNLFFSSWLQILTGRLADRFDRRRMVIAGSLVSYAVMATIPFAANLRQLVVLFFIRALGTAISMPGSAGLYVGIGRKQGMGSTIALMGMATSLGLALGPILSGLVAEFTEIRSVFFFAAGMGFIGLVLFAVLSAREPREPTPEQIIREEETK
jgi:MFS family permease